LAKKKSRTSSNGAEGSAGVGRRGGAPAAVIAEPRGIGGCLLARLLQLAALRDEGARQRRHVGRQFPDVGERDGFWRRRVGERVAQFADQPRLVIVGEKLQVRAEGGVQLQQHRHGQRPLVVLDLVEIAQRDSERVGQRLLGQDVLLAQPLQAHAHEGLLHAQTLLSIFANFAN
jgi:hypothetical protein